MTYSTFGFAGENSQEARVLYQKGGVAFKKGDDSLAQKYYRESLELEESFETMCNLARSEARSELFGEAYEHIRMCLYLFPEDPELEGPKSKYASLRDHVRTELTFEEARPIDEKVDKEIERRESKTTHVADAKSPILPASGLDDEEPPVVEDSSSSAKLPVTITIGSLGVIGITTGAILMSVSNSQQNKADDLRSEIFEDSSLPENSVCFDPSRDPRCRELSDSVKGYDSTRNAAVASLAVGGTLVVGAAIAYFLWPESKERTAGVQPTAEFAGNGGWQLGIQGEF